ncbi:MAG: metalloregulator ArsR/SmtB family transcription factor [Chloroflexi bacterium]|nr:metalloregulator ArsR/SmtB family transcription factor [Chloroflexota bacterium]
MITATHTDSVRALVRFFKALADENRLRMLGLLAGRECSVEELASLLRRTPPTVSHHLNRLKEAGLVQMRAEGTTHLYRLDAEALRSLSKEVFTPERMASAAEGVEGDAWERKVLRDFFENGRLKEVPASRKKRLVILKWLADQFDLGRRYTEREVNEVVKRYHEDAATLRRELIGNKLMQRESGMYWRVPDVDEARSGRRWTY